MCWTYVPISEFFIHWYFASVFDFKIQTRYVPFQESFYTNICGFYVHKYLCDVVRFYAYLDDVLFMYALPWTRLIFWRLMLWLLLSTLFWSGSVRSLSKAFVTRLMHNLVFSKNSKNLKKIFGFKIRNSENWRFLLRP